MKQKLFFILTATMFLSSQAVQAGSLENLERERALTVMEMIDGELSAEDRWEKLAAAKRRLADWKELS